MVVLVLGLTQNHLCHIGKDHKIVHKTLAEKKSEMNQNWEWNIVSHWENPVSDDRIKHGLQFRKTVKKKNLVVKFCKTE